MIRTHLCLSAYRLTAMLVGWHCAPAEAELIGDLKKRTSVPISPIKQRSSMAGARCAPYTLSEDTLNPIHSDFSCQQLLDTLAGMPAIKRYWLAYSGGADSHVLLQLFCQARDAGDIQQPIYAIHVNHGLQDVAEEWVDHCIQTCQRLDVVCRIVSLKLQPKSGESIEALARTRRYEAFADIMEPGDALVTAHHLEDQTGIGRAHV